MSTSTHTSGTYTWDPHGTGTLWDGDDYVETPRSRYGPELCAECADPHHALSECMGTAGCPCCEETATNYSINNRIQRPTYGLGTPTSTVTRYSSNSTVPAWNDPARIPSSWQTRYPAYKPYQPYKPYKPTPSWRTCYWNAERSEWCAQSCNVFVRVYGMYRDAQNGFWSCPDHRHWGMRGAAGILPYCVARDGRVWVLMSERGAGVQNSGTWSCFGGAVDKDESAWEAAVRECYEELSGLPKDGTVVAELRLPCESCGWAYTTFIVRVPTPRSDYLPRVHPKSWETRGVSWVRVGHVSERPLHPGFEAAWSKAREVIGRHAS